MVGGIPSPTFDLMANKVTKKKAAKPVAKKSASQKVARKTVKRAGEKVPLKKVAKKAPAKKTAVKVLAKKAVAKKAVTKKAVTKKAVTKKAVAKKAVAKKAVAKKAVAKKAAKKILKGAVKPAPVKKAAKKAPVKKTAKKQVVEAPVKAVVKKVLKRAARKAVKVEDLEPIVVKRPYVRPEKVAKLSPFEKRQQKRLLDLRDQITDSMYGIQNDTIKNGNEGSDSSGSGMHQGDAGSDAYDRDFALTMLSKEANALGEIEQALQRLELGTYGICEQSGQKIPQPRLEAMPFARLTVECQAAKEKNDSLRDTSSRDFGYN